MVLLIVICQDEQHLFDVENFADLKAQADEGFGYLAEDGMVLTLRYPFKTTHININDQRGFDTFLKMFSRENASNPDAVPTLMVMQSKPVSIPVSTGTTPAELTPRDGLAAEELPAARKATGPRKAAPPPRRQQQGQEEGGSPPRHNHDLGAQQHYEKAAVLAGLESPKANWPEMDKDYDPNSPHYPEETVAKTAGEDVSPPRYPENAFTRPLNARQLLETFREPSPEKGPTIRAVLRQGGFSCDVPYDPYNPPSVSDLFDRVKEGCKELFEKGIVKPHSELCLSVLNPQCQESGEFDLEDAGDVSLLTQKVFDEGAAAAQIVVEFNEPGSQALQGYLASPHRGDGGFLPNNSAALEYFFKGEDMSPKRRLGLGVNLCQTPRRDKLKRGSRPITPGGEFSRPTTPGSNLGRPMSRPGSALSRGVSPHRIQPQYGSPEK